MKNTSFSIALILCVTSGFAHANLLTNGSFEDTTGFVDNTGQHIMELFPGSTALPGWSVTNTSGLDLNWLGPFNPISPASDGSYSLDLTGYHNSSPFSGVSQTLATLLGHTYEVGFDLGNDGSFRSGILASAGGVSQNFVTTFASAGHRWDHFSFFFTAAASSEVISFIGSQQVVNNPIYIGLDNVTVLDVTPNALSVPEPGSLFLIGLGLAGLRAARWTWRPR